MSNSFIGLGKTLFKSSVAKIEATGDFEIVLNERLSRIKNDGSWPLKALQSIPISESDLLVENRDVKNPLEHESALDRAYPFFSLLEKKGMTQFSRKYNKDIQFLSHHLAHAYSALKISPFEESMIVVIDGAGSAVSDLTGKEKEFCREEESSFEAISCYHQIGHQLRPLEKKFQKFIPSEKYRAHTWSTHIGLFYEKIAEFVFGSKQAAGKVMGLAPFGKILTVDSYHDFLESLDWNNKAYQKEDDKGWESSPHMDLYQNLAATAQYEFEKVYLNFLETIKGQYPHIKNLILTGGCALNCTANGKLLERNWFEQVYVSPFPGDESIGHGCASYAFIQAYPERWEKIDYENQHSFYGKKQDQLSLSRLKDVFPASHYDIAKLDDDYSSVVSVLEKGEVICWYRGRSESGPRSLGHRSILALPQRKNLKKYLNDHIKFRESFRPYGSSVLKEQASQYFEVGDSFENPFMSFAVKVKDQYRELLKEVSHIDQTSRMQTVRKTSNPAFYRLLEQVGKKTGHPVLLNTSFNKMGEPIIETVEEAAEFMEKSVINYLVYEDYLIVKK